jgi:uncharacterized protein
MIVRTPFGIGPYGSDEYSTAATHTDAFPKAGYIWMRQDVRGRRLSEGRFVPMTPHRPEKRTHTDVDESTDTYDMGNGCCNMCPITTAALAFGKFRMRVFTLRPE